jgi:hypothetical protein
MRKTTKNVPAITQAAGLAGRAIARLEAEAKAIHSLSVENEKRLQLISSKSAGFQALIRHGHTVIEIQGDDFSVRQD